MTILLFSLFILQQGKLEGLLGGYRDVYYSEAIENVPMCVSQLSVTVM